LSKYVDKQSLFPMSLRSLYVKVLLSYMIRDQDTIPPRLSTSAAFCIAHCVCLGWNPASLGLKSLADTPFIRTPQGHCFPYFPLICMWAGRIAARGTLTYGAVYFNELYGVSQHKGVYTYNMKIDVQILKD